MFDALFSPQVLAAVVAGLFSLIASILALRAARKVNMVQDQLSVLRFDPYRELWSLLADQAPSPEVALTPKARSTLLKTLYKWYTKDGNGIFLSLAARDVF